MPFWRRMAWVTLATAPARRCHRRGRARSSRWRWACSRSSVFSYTTPTPLRLPAIRRASGCLQHALVNNFNGMYGNFLSNGAHLPGRAPPIVGAFLGAPVLARELESGTFRFAWTQGFGRWRWTLAKLVTLGVVVTALAGAISVLFSWYYQPVFRLPGNQALVQESPDHFTFRHLPRSLPACSICAGRFFRRLDSGPLSRSASSSAACSFAGSSLPS